MTSEPENLTTGSLWARVDARLANRSNQAPGDDKGEADKRFLRRYRWVVDAILPISMAVVVGIGVMLPAGLSFEARISLFAFALATILWSTTRINAAFIALAVTIVLVVAGGRPQKALFDSLASDVIWLMIGAFILGEAVKKTNLAARLTNVLTARASKVKQVFWLLTAALVILSFFVPSTSGRAAVAFSTVSLVLLLAAYLASDLFKPLEALKNALKRTAHGDYNQALDDSREDEFGEVNRAFNEMVRTIAQREKLSGGADDDNAELGFNSLTSKMTIHRLVAQIRLQIIELAAQLGKADAEDSAQIDEKKSGRKVDLEPLVENLEQLSQAIVRVADFSFPLDISLSKTDVRALLYDTLLHFHGELSRRGVSFEMEIAPDIGFAALDHLKIREAINELIRNALKALPESGGKIGLRARIEAQNLLMEVADDGKGSDENFLDAAESRRNRHLKTGLKLTKEIIEQHGGKLKINSEAGEGTFVQIALPLRVEA